MKKFAKFITFASTVALVATAPLAIQADSKEQLKVGIMTLDDATEPVWDKVEELADKEGVDLEFTEFTDYNQPNEAVQNNEIDVNAFQHYSFLNTWNADNKGDLVAAADTLLSPIRLFSGTKGKNAKYTKVTDIPKGGTISIPNDPTNGSRALYLLESAGLIELGVSGGEEATVKDIKKNPKKLKIKEVDASQTASTLSSVDAAVINNSYAQSSNVDYKTTLYKEEVNDNSKLWVNIIAAKKGWEKGDKAKAIKTLIKVYQTDEVGKLIQSASNDVDIPAWEGAKTAK